MRRLFDIEAWPRKNHYRFFKDFDEPFFGITTQLDFTKAYEHSKDLKASFFLFYVHLALKSANNIQEFKLRIDGNELYIYDQINASPTISRDNGTFGFSQLEYQEDFQTFYTDAIIEVEKVKNSDTLVPDSELNFIQFSALPWINFTSLSHARHFQFKDSIPKISFGKLMDEGSKKMMSVSVHVNHAIADGYHVGQFLELFQTNLNSNS